LYKIAKAQEGDSYFLKVTPFPPV